MIELEKRWKLKGKIPVENTIDKFTIIQTYSNFKPDVRIRKIVRDDKEEYSHCVKYQLQNNEREEIEQKISKERYERIFNTINKKPIIKERAIVDIGNELFAEVDNYTGTGDIIIEVEFKNQEQMNNFSPPSWFSSEIKNKSFSYEVFCKMNNIHKSIWD